MHLRCMSSTKSLLDVSCTLLFLAAAIALLTSAQTTVPFAALYVVSLGPLLARWVLKEVVLENLHVDAETFQEKQAFNSLKSPE